MSYCTKCGKQNPDTSKFCTGCGGTLIAKPDTYNPTVNPQEKEKGKKINWAIIGILAVLLISAAIYFLFFNKSKAAEKNTDNNVVQKDTTVSRPPVATVSDPAPLKPSIKEAEITISQTEVDNVSRRLDEFYDYETKEDITNLFSYYRFPLDRYYQLYNVSYDKLHKMVTEAYNGKLYYHSINIKWNYSSVQKISTGGYKTLMFAEYTSASQSDENRKTKDIHLIILMNNNYEITAIYPN